MYEPTLSPAHHRRATYPRRRRISLQIALLLFILGYLGRTALYSIEHSRDQTCYRDSTVFSKESWGTSESTRSREQDTTTLRVIEHSAEGHQSIIHADVDRIPSIDREKQSDEKEKQLDKFSEALENVLLALPELPEIVDALGPIEGTGEAMVREIGLRARLFKSALDAWEALHTVMFEDRIQIRSDVLQHIVKNPKLATRLQLDHTTLIHKYEEFHSYFVAFSERLFSWTLPYFPDLVTLHAQLWSGGRGIVLTGGDHQASYLLTSIQSMRDMGCELPIEVMYLGEDDLGRENRRKLEKVKGVITRDLSPLVNDKGWKLKGWALKPFAIMLSSFREAIFIDADSLFLRDPSILFSDPEYQSTGALFFKDRVIEPASKLAWLKRILPPPISAQVRRNRFWTGTSSHMQESGVVVVDKWKHFVALMVITRLNGPDRDGNEAEGRIGVYDMVFGMALSLSVPPKIQFQNHHIIPSSSCLLPITLPAPSSNKSPFSLSQATRKPSGSDSNSSATQATPFTTAKSPSSASRNQTLQTKHTTPKTRTTTPTTPPPTPTSPAPNPPFQSALLNSSISTWTVDRSGSTGGCCRANSPTIPDYSLSISPRSSWKRWMGSI